MIFLTAASAKTLLLMNSSPRFYSHVSSAWTKISLLLFHAHALTTPSTSWGRLQLLFLSSSSFLFPPVICRAPGIRVLLAAQTSAFCNPTQLSYSRRSAIHLFLLPATDPVAEMVYQTTIRFAVNDWCPLSPSVSCGPGCLQRFSFPLARLMNVAAPSHSLLFVQGNWSCGSWTFLVSLLVLFHHHSSGTWVTGFTTLPWNISLGIIINLLKIF